MQFTLEHATNENKRGRHEWFVTAPALVLEQIPRY